MLAEYGTLSLAEVLAPAISMADGYPIEAEAANAIERDKALLKRWRSSARIMLPHSADAAGRGAPRSAARRRNFPPTGTRRDAA
jgi:gamma-glutamyltranspeptidase/glutathione hydrolase